MVKARLDLPVVEKLRIEGYSMAIIRYCSYLIEINKLPLLIFLFMYRKVYEMQLRFKSTVESLVDVRCWMFDFSRG